MKIIKLPVEYIRFLNEENHVIYGRYEYWMFLKSHNGFGWRVGTCAAISRPETQKR